MLPAVLSAFILELCTMGLPDGMTYGGGRLVPVRPSQGERVASYLENSPGILKADSKTIFCYFQRPGGEL